MGSERMVVMEYYFEAIYFRSSSLVKSFDLRT